MRNAVGWLPALALMGFIFWLSSIPGDVLPPPLFDFGDKLQHFLAYAVLGSLLAARSGFGSLLAGSKPSFWTSGGWAAPLSGIAYGFLDEIHQIYVPLRRCDGIDMMADALGVLAGFYLMRRWDFRRQAKARPFLQP